ncbi:Transcriptional activator protein acu-15 [Cytospora mali]|nr:Transcriptional activator protein acu-15 [Valsa mali var. pyri (nom. inval.)]
MPGILPMKVIKCANVGFECRTSDKLSRRAFPRGYTESLEERVRALEAEVRDLKDLLDEKDEKIEMLSKMHGNRRRLSVSSGPGLVSNASSPEVESGPGREPSPPKEDTFRVQASPLLLGVENSDSYFMGPSSGRGFIEGFKRKLQERGRPCSDFSTEAYLHIQGCHPLVPKESPVTMRVPPRLFSDRCVNVYFQEWAPLFPVLHKPTFLRIYEEFVADPEKIKNNHKLAQLHLVFGVAALSSDNPDLEQIDACEQQWQRSLEAVLMENTMNSLQCLVLALMYCTVRADYKRLQYYKGIAVGLSHRLGLHQSQKRFSFGALTTETRKKVFWTLYTLDCFSAATLGLPKLIKEEDAHAEYPSDTDDEYVTEKGFQPTLPGEYTRLSSALALFRAARIMAKVLEKIYPAATSYELSLQQMSALEAELDDWSDKLPQHLKLNFRQDKPSTDITGSRSPLLALTYYYIRTLIFRPAVGSSLGPKAASALLSISDSAKHMIQIAQLLEERSMSFSFCLDKTDLLSVCSMTLLYQGLDLNQDSKMLRENERLVNAAVKIVERMKAPGTYDFKGIAGLLISVDEPPSSRSTPPRQSSGMSMAAPPPQRSSPTYKPKKKTSSGAQPQQNSLGRHSGGSMSETDLNRPTGVKPFFIPDVL